MKATTADGRSIRPDLVIPDDCQTDRSAANSEQCDKREQLLTGAVLGLAGPGKKISGVAPVTVIKVGDLADRLLDPVRNPEWNGERCKLVYAWPTNKELWDEYRDIRARSLRGGDGGREATEFYRRNRKAMDKGAKVGWSQRFNEDELSAIQHAVNLQMTNKRTFASEYQNEPLGEENGMMTAAEIAARINRVDQLELPIRSTIVTAGVDVQKECLFWLVAAWSEDFTGAVIDYGAWPEQGRNYFTLNDVRPSFSDVLGDYSIEQKIAIALDRLVTPMLAKRWTREDEAKFEVDQVLIDANWGISTDVVYGFCRKSQTRRVMPAHGRYVGAASTPFSEHKLKPGEQQGAGWRIPLVTGRRQVRHLLFDSNYYKSFVHQRLAVKIGDAGGLTFFGEDARRHDILGDHLTAETFVTTEGRNRQVDEWKLKPSRTDNHFLDCLAMAAAGASYRGAKLPEVAAMQPQKRTRRSLGAMYGR